MPEIEDLVLDDFKSVASKALHYLSSKHKPKTEIEALIIISSALVWAGKIRGKKSLVEYLMESGETDEDTATRLADQLVKFCDDTNLQGEAEA